YSTCPAWTCCPTELTWSFLITPSIFALRLKIRLSSAATLPYVWMSWLNVCHLAAAKRTPSLCCVAVLRCTPCSGRAGLGCVGLFHFHQIHAADRAYTWMVADNMRMHGTHPKFFYWFC